MKQMPDETDGNTRASLGRIERDIEHLDRKFDAFISQHQIKHDTDQSNYNSHLITSATTAASASRAETAVNLLDTKVDTIEIWRHELLGAMRLVKLAFGTSILSALATIVGMAVALSR